jgi:hypothetical protein
MAQVNKKHVGAGSHGKGSGTGGLTDDPTIPDNKVLSNRDKALHSDERGQDTKWVQTEQSQEHEANQRKK